MILPSPDYEPANSGAALNKITVYHLQKGEMSEKLSTAR